MRVIHFLSAYTIINVFAIFIIKGFISWINKGIPEFTSSNFFLSPVGLSGWYFFERFLKDCLIYYLVALTGNSEFNSLYIRHHSKSCPECKGTGQLDREKPELLTMTSCLYVWLQFKLYFVNELIYILYNIVEQRFKTKDGAQTLIWNLKQELPSQKSSSELLIFHSIRLIIWLLEWYFSLLSGLF